MPDFSRQSFLGANSDATLRRATIGIVGYSGGGSHYGQQFAHIGIGNFVVVDPDIIEESNRHRLVGSEALDVSSGAAKVDIAKRQILRGNPRACVKAIKARWQDATESLAECDIVYGALDSFRERDELERFCRRNLLPYIDIGMAVTKSEFGEFAISGQVIQSLPGGHCLRCCGIVTDESIAIEADAYGEAGPEPQVVWPNAILASAGIGFGVNLLTPWFRSDAKLRWLTYDGNKGTLTEPKIITQFLDGKECPHHPAVEVGDPLADIRKWTGASPNQSIDNSRIGRFKRLLDRIGLR